MNINRLFGLSSLVTASLLFPMFISPASASGTPAENATVVLSKVGNDFQILISGGVNDPTPVRRAVAFTQGAGEFSITGLELNGSNTSRTAVNQSGPPSQLAGSELWAHTATTNLTLTAGVSSFTPITAQYVFACVYTEWGTGSPVTRVICSATTANPNSTGSAGVSEEATPAPAKYAGPEFSGLAAKGIMAGTSPRLEGKNLDEISSIEIGGKAATFTLDGDKALDLTLPEGLAPGLYDLVINSSAGKLTHINAIQVREPRRAFSVTTRSEGRISEDQYREHTIISAMQIPELNKARCIVNGSNLALAKAQAERLCALVAAANPNIETTVIEPRSTVKNSTVFARVTYGWN